MCFFSSCICSTGFATSSKTNFGYYIFSVTVINSISILLRPKSTDLPNSAHFLTRKTDRIKGYISNQVHPGTFVYLVNQTDLFITARLHEAGHLSYNAFHASQEHVVEHDPLQRAVLQGTDRDALSNAAMV